MTLAVATPPVVRALVAKLQEKPTYPRAFGIHAQPVWHHEPALSVAGATVQVRTCVSALAVREALVEHHASDATSYLCVVTDCTDEDLGAGIRAHLARGQLIEVDLWETLRASFHATAIDPAFVARDRAWAPLALIEHEPAGGWPEAPGGRLTRDVALAALAGQVLGLPGEHLDSTSLLRWTADPVAVRRYLELAEPVREGLGAWLVERTGPAGAMTLRAAVAGNASDAAALALVTDLLWHQSADPATTGVARGLLAHRLGGAVPTQTESRAWGRVAQLLVSAELAEGVAHAVSVVERAEQLLVELQAQAVVPLSAFLPAALDQRLLALAQPLQAALPSPDPTSMGAVETALSRLVEHELAHGSARVETATMAVRLTRWLASAPAMGSRADQVNTLADALDRQVRVDAWVDRAHADVWSGDPDPALANAYAGLATAVAARRAGHDQQLARLLADATGSDADLGRIIPVEQALARVVAPLASTERGVLLVVVDGMSTAVATEIAAGMMQRRWTELVERDRGARQGLLAALPSLTEVSRTSLLTGSLQVGHAAEEKKHFAAAVGTTAKLFHKDDLRAPAGASLAPAVAAAIADTDVRVVGVVLNTVDDTLHHTDPGGTTWTLEQVQHLAPLIDAARAADRVVVLTSDHGHVVERGSTHTPYAGVSSPRWRPVSPTAADGEVLLSGPRVLLGGGSVVLPWREDLRYAAKCAGYHGGASAAEVTIPLTVHVRGTVSELAGWVPATPAEPAWWLSPLAPSRPTLLSAQTPVAPTLFETAPPSGGPDPVTALVDALVGCAVYADQRRRAGRTAPDDARVRAVIGALLRHDGRLHETTLAAAADIPAMRLRNVLAAVRKLLNVEGYDVLALDPDQVTVVLDLPLLREQFRLEAAS